MNPLDVLGLDQSCTMEDVKKKFRRLSFLYHPDKHPGDEKAAESFRTLVNAYEEIKKNPSIINKKESSTSYDDAIYAEIDVTIEDLYFEITKSIKLKRIISCPTCKGLGTKDIHNGLCELCKGLGQINNKILSMMKRSNSCPSCKGLGINKAYICVDCRGKKVKDELKTYTFPLSLKNYNNKCVILNGEGNQFPFNHEGDVIIKLNIEKNPAYSIEDEKLCIDFNITPVQNLIGDTCEVNVFGKIFKFRVPNINNKIILEDKRKGFLHPRKIAIKTVLSKPVLNKEIIGLYEKILVLEKKEITTPLVG